MKAVRTRLGQALNIPARSNSEMMSHFSRHECSLLILDRCEAAIGNARTQFVWFVNQLLSKSSELKVLIATQVPLGVKAEAPEGFGFHTAGDVDLVFTPVTVERMRPKDAALLLLELCERELTQEELSQQHLGYSPQVREAMLTMGGPLMGVGPLEECEAQFTPVQALISHPIMPLLDGMPMAVRWCARRLSSGGCTLDRLYGELERLPRAELLRLIATNTSTSELASVPGSTAGSTPLQLRQNSGSMDSGSMDAPMPHPTLRPPQAP